jgi:cytochrome P450
METQTDRPVPIESATLDTDTIAQRRLRFPIGGAITLEELEGYESGILAQRVLREREPVTWFDEVQAWLVTSRRLVDEVVGAHERFIVYAERSFNRAVLGDHMLSRDGDDHHRLRAPYDPSLRLRAVREHYTDLISDLADGLIAPLRYGQAAELRSTYANPLAITVSGRALGLAFEDIGEVSEAYDVFASKLCDYSGVLRDIVPTRAALDDLIYRNIERIRHQPDSSIISSVLTAETPELRHSDEQIVANVRILLFGAIETVTSIILSTSWALLSHPRQLAEALADPGLFVGAVNEALRWISPVGHTERWAAMDTQLGGIPIRRGEMLFPSLAAANRDPEFFPDPDTFNIHRANARNHAAFGRGEHHCIGLNLGNLEAQIAVQRLFSQLTNLRLDPDRPSAPTGFGFRSPRQMHVRWE